MLNRNRIKGFAFLPFLLANWQMIAIAGLALVVGGYYLHCEHVKRDHATFVAKLEAQAEEQTKQAKLKEAQDAKRIQDALSDRDAALKRLRQRPNPVNLSSLPVNPADNTKLCFDRAGLDAALQRFTKGVDGLVAEGDTAIINQRALRDSWPK